MFLGRTSWNPIAHNAVLFGLDQHDPHVRAGMRITFELIKKMNEICQQSHVQFLIVVIPTGRLMRTGEMLEAVNPAGGLAALAHPSRRDAWKPFESS
jgi:hypothetical protein